MFIRLLLLALLALTVPALAAPPAPADSKKISDCLAAAGEEMGTSCIGIIADACIKASASSDQTGNKVKACAARELAVWEAQLAAAIKLVNSGGFPEAIKSVSAAQQGWRKSRDTLCPVFDKIDPGMFLGGANYCRLLDTAQRVLILRKLGAAFQEH